MLFDDQSKETVASQGEDVPNLRMGEIIKLRKAWKQLVRNLRPDSEISY